MTFLQPPKTPQNTNIAGGRGRGRNPSLGRKTFIDDLVARTNSSTRVCHQGSSARRSPIIPRVEASVSTVENIGGAATPLGAPIVLETFTTLHTHFGQFVLVTPLS